MINRPLDQGYARSAGESVFPNFWKGLILAYAAPLANTGPTIRDFSGKGEHHPLDNITTALAWKIGNNTRVPGRVFDFSSSTDSSAENINLTGLSSSSQDYTFVFYMYVDDPSITSSGLAYIFDSLTGRMIIATSQNGSVDNFNVHDGTAWRSFTTTPVDVWTHTVVTMNSVNSLCEVFFDAVSQGTNTYAGTTIGSTTRLFDSHSNNVPYNGKMSYVLIYDRVFTDAEVLEEYRNPLGLFRRRRRGVFKAPAVGGTTPKGPFGMPFHGPFGGPI